LDSGLDGGAFKGLKGKKGFKGFNGSKGAAISTRICTVTKALRSGIDLFSALDKGVDQAARDFVKQGANQSSKDILKVVLQIEFNAASPLALQGMKIPHAREILEGSLDQLKADLFVQNVHIAGGEGLFKAPDGHANLSSYAIGMRLQDAAFFAPRQELGVTLDIGDQVVHFLCAEPNENGFMNGFHQKIWENGSPKR
jgi:hypothetical protein